MAHHSNSAEWAEGQGVKCIIGMRNPMHSSYTEFQVTLNSQGTFGGEDRKMCCPGLAQRHEP